MSSVYVNRAGLLRRINDLEDAIDLLKSVFRGDDREESIVSRLEGVLSFLEGTVESESGHSQGRGQGQSDHDKGGHSQGRGQGQSDHDKGSRGRGGGSRKRKQPPTGTPSHIRRPTPMGSQRVYSAEPVGPTRVEQHVVSGSCSYSSDIVKCPRGELLSEVSEGDRAGVFSKHVTHLLTEHSNTALVESVIDLALSVTAPSVHGSDPTFGSAMVTQLKPLMRLSSLVANACSHAVGSLFHSLVREEGVDATSLVVLVCNAAENEKQRRQCEVLTACATSGCTECQASLDSQAATRPCACSKTQVLLRLRSHELLNFTPTYIKQTMEFAKLPLRSPLVLSAEPHSVTRQVPKLVQQLTPSVEKLCGTCTTGASPVFHVRGNPVISVHYVDGDGGCVDVRQIPGLEDHARSKGIVPCCLTTHTPQVLLVPFRELHHDAIELGHLYSVRDRASGSEVLRQHFGYEALVKARANVANAVKVVVVPHNTDRSGQRLLLEVFTLEEGEDCFKSTAVRLIESGLSFPASNAPVVFQKAFESAARAKAGVHQCDHGLLVDEPLRPWDLKPRLARVKDSCTVPRQGFDVTVSNVDLHLNEANLLVLPSLLPGAGLGLFLRPPRSRVTVPEKRRVCLYSDRPMAAGDPADSDYVITVDGGTQYNPAVYDGRTIGRFVNQGGLIDGMKKMVLDSNLATCSSFSSGETKAALLNGCNVEFKRERPNVVVFATRRPIVATPDSPVELLGSYGYEYWVCIILNRPNLFNYREDEVAKCVLWVLLSTQSNWSREVRDKYLTGHDIPEDILSHFRGLECPYSLPPRRRH